MSRSRRCAARTARRPSASRPRYGGAAYDDVGRFLDHRPLDVVAIGSPSGLHAEQTIAAIRRGLHVIAEKPLDVTTAKVDAVIAEADRQGVKVGVFFQDRLKPDIATMKTMIASGRVGTPIFAAGRVRWYRPPEYYARLALARHVGARRRRRADEPGHPHGRSAALAVRPGRAGGRADGDAAAHDRGRRHGRGGHRVRQRRARRPRSDDVVVSRATRAGSTSADPRARWCSRATGSSASICGIRPSTRPPPTRAPENASSPTVSDSVPHQRVFEDFLGALEAGRAPACDAREARHSVAIVEAIYRSARSGKFERP